MHDLLPSLHGQLNQVFQSLPYFVPELCLSVLFIAVLVTDLIFGKNSGWICRILAVAGLLGIIFKDFQQFQLLLNGGQLFFSGMLLLTRTTLILKLMTDLFA